MSQHAKNISILWSALEDVNDVFCRMGGAAVYPGYEDEDSATGTAILLLERLATDWAENNNLRHLLPPGFWETARPVCQDIEKRFIGLDVSGAGSADSLWGEFVRYVESRGAVLAHGSWERLREQVGHDE